MDAANTPAIPVCFMSERLSIKVYLRWSGCGEQQLMPYSKNLFFLSLIDLGFSAHVFRLQGSTQAGKRARIEASIPAASKP
jgi:hypothetical protein